MNHVGLMLWRMFWSPYNLHLGMVEQTNGSQEISIGIGYVLSFPQLLLRNFFAILS